MPRLTITLSDRRHRQLKLRAALEGKTVSNLIEEAMSELETRRRERAREILEMAWKHAAETRPGETEDDVMRLALELEAEARSSRQQS
jgi:hypothetical protein